MKGIRAAKPTDAELIALGRAMLKVRGEPGKAFAFDVVNDRDGNKAHFHVAAVRVEERGGASHVSSTEPMTPPPLLRAGALLKRAAGHAERLADDLQAVVNSILPEQTAVAAEPSTRHLLMLAELVQAVRVRMLDARTAVARLPELASAAEALHAAHPPGVAQEGGVP